MSREEAESRDEGRILVVDDEDDIREVLQIFLESQGFAVSLASDGAAGLAIARAGGIDVIVLDVMMPGMGGFEVCRELKQDAATAAIPVILLTARDDIDARIEGMRGEVAEFLAKPVSSEELLLRIKTQVRARRREQELERAQARAATLGGR